MAVSPLPAFLAAIEDHRLARELVVVQGNTRDRLILLNVTPLGANGDSATPIPPRYLPQSLTSFYGREFAVYYYSLDTGLVAQHPPGYPHRSTPLDDVQERAPARVFPRLTEQLRSAEQPTLIIIDNIQHIAPASEGMTAALSEDQLVVLETCARWAGDDAIRRTGNFVILIAHEDSVHPLLTRQTSYREVTIPLPDEDERTVFLRYLDDLRHGGRTEFAELPGDERVTLARESAGLRLVDLEALSRRAAASSEPITRAAVRARKEQSIRQLSGDLLDLVQPEHGLDSVAGQVHAVDAFREVIAQWRLGDPNVPKGILLVGPPGQGKSFSVAGFAHELGLPLLRMRNLRSPYVGASEANQQRAFFLIESMAPVVVFVDEIDTAIGRRSEPGMSGDSGTSERMFGEFLEFFGAEKRRGKVVLVGASNRPSALDGAVLDRMGMVIPYLPPSPSDVVMLLPVIARQLGITLARNVDVATVAALPNLQQPTVRMLAEILATAARWAANDAGRSGAAVSGNVLLAAAKSFKPNYDPLDMERMALEAVQMTSMQYLLPWMSRQGRRDGVTIPPFLKRCVDDDGQVRVDALQSRLRELTRRVGG